MKKALIAGVALLVVAGSTAGYAEYRAHHAPFSRMSAEDRSAFVDARIAAVHAGLKLNADQEKNWPAVEAAVRGLAKLRMDRVNARMSERDARRSGASTAPRDPVARLRERADDMGTSAAALKTLADAADPLYKSLDDGQKRRLMRLAGAGFGREGRAMMRGMERMDGFGGPMNFRRLDRRDRDGGRDTPRHEDPAETGSGRL